MLRFTQYTYFDSYGRVSVLPVVLGQISCTQYSDGPAIYTDQFGHTLSVTTSGASLWTNGTWQTVPLQLVGPGLTPGPPFGSFDTPGVNATGLSGAINVTGWALDPIQATGISIFREPVANEPAGLVYIGEANFVAGARPDVASQYSN